MCISRLSVEYVASGSCKVKAESRKILIVAILLPRKRKDPRPQELAPRVRASPICRCFLFLMGVLVQPKGAHKLNGMMVAVSGGAVSASLLTASEYRF